MKVKGRGNINSRILLLGEKPGAEELKLGKVFLGRTGTELDKILWRYGVQQEDVWLDNLLEDAPTGKDWTVTDEDLIRNQDHINDTIYKKFDKVVTMGAVTTRWMLGNGVRSDIGTVHAIPHKTDWCDVFPTYHPAAGLHDSDAYPYIAYDFGILSTWLDGNYTGGVRVDEFRGKEKYTPLNDRDVNFIRGRFRRNVYTHIFVDTEGSKEKPWCLTWSLEPGEGFMIQPQHKEAIKTLIEEVEGAGLVVVCHYAVHDIPVLRAMGWEIVRDLDTGCVLDTMVAAYLLQVEPQGLKNLCYRHFDMEMQDYMDLVGPYSLDKQVDWLLRVFDCGWPKPEPVLVEEKMETRLVQPQGLEPRISKLLSKIEEGGEVNIWKWWHTLKSTYPTITGPVEEKLGTIPSATLDDIPFEDAFRYACRDSDGTCRTFWRLIERLDQMDLYKTFIMDCACIPMIEEMQTTGFKVEPEHFKKLAVEWRGEQGKIRKELADKYTDGEIINCESQPQTAYWIYKKWKLPVFKETEGGQPSTSDKAIDWMKDKHPGIGLIGRSREYDKGVTSFAEPILRYCADDPDHRIHTNLKYTRVVSGRFSAADPNLLAMPVRSDLGKKIRQGFVAADGCWLGSWDLNQIEMRFMAHESEDEDLCQAYMDDKDIHKETASRMFEIETNEVDNERREVAKRISFGVITGITGQGLRDQFYLNGITKYSADQCDKFIEIWFRARPRVKSYLEQCRSEARRFGGVRDSIGGRLRYLQGIQSTNKRIMAESERASHSHRISAGAQAILKLGMAELWPRIKELREADGVRIKWVLQVHDELIFEFEQGYEETLDTIIKEALCETVKLRVPIKAKGKWGKTWGELK